MNLSSDQIRLAIPSKGRMQSSVTEFFDTCGLQIRRRNRNYLASIAGFPDVQVVLQRQEDIVKGVEQNMLQFGVVGFDLANEVPDHPENIVIVHSGLGFGKCRLELAVPENMGVNSLDDLKAKQQVLGKLRVATGFPNLTTKFLHGHNIDFELVSGAGTLEVSPALGNADIISDLVSTGGTLAANRLKTIDGGKIIDSQGVIIANRTALQDQNVLKVAKRLLEYIEATLRAEQYYSVHANMRGSYTDDAEAKIKKLFSKPGLEGLNGPTVNKVINKTGEEWFAIHVIVAKSHLMEAIESLREVGGSGVVVTPTTYIFEEELEAYQSLLKRLQTQ